LTPDECCADIFSAPLDELIKNGVAGILLDVDGTIVESGMSEVSEEVVWWVRSLVEQGLKVCIVSNSRQKWRIAKIAEKLELPYVCHAAKPLRGGLRRAACLLELNPNQLTIIGDRLLTDVLGGKRLRMFTVRVEGANLHGRGLMAWLVRLLEGCFASMHRSRFSRL